MRRICLYSHDAQGLGHVRRNIAVARALIAHDQCSVLLVSGARESGVFPLPAGADSLSLPALAKQPGGGYGSRSLSVDLGAMVRLRSEILRTALTAFNPDALVVDKLPSGVEDELLPSLAALRGTGTRVVLGLREILDEPERVRADWDRSTFEEVVRAYYDAIFVYGDPRVFDPRVEYDMPGDLADMVRFTGYVDRRQVEPRAITGVDPRAVYGLPSGRICLCTVGGGEDGHALTDAFARAAMPAGATGVIVAGPFMPAAQRAGIEELVAARRDLILLPSVPNGDELIALDRKS